MALPRVFAWAMLAAVQSAAWFASPVAAREAAQPAARVTLPPYVRIEYRVTWGDNGFVVGTTVQESRLGATHFSLRNTAETTGFVRLFKRATVVNASEGDIVAGGLRPHRFRIERSSGRNESADLDWRAGEVRMSNGRSFKLEPGTQDMLSLFTQLALVDIDGDVVSIPVMTSKRVERYDFEVLGKENIKTPRGERMTLHLRHREPDSKEATEIWLGLDDARLPIKIRHVDRKGTVFDQIAVRIDTTETREGTR
ncbi:MAG: DUF3108 domain-containing protein [Gammaproteobacteria bacterium]|nr:DUF3108 domain-containing protein [Gammaproteobacteria bacterium]MBU1416788.1 DUF3108 domain-containing protein [Gammaproteobacteria bacterium]